MREQVVTPSETLVNEAKASKVSTSEPNSFMVTYEAGTQVHGPKKIVAESYKLSDSGSTISFLDKDKKTVALFNFQNVVSIELSPKG